MSFKRLLLCAALATVTLCTTGVALAQDDSSKAPAKSELENAQEKAARMMEAWVKASIEFSKDIRLTEDDLKKWIALAPSFNAIGSEDEEDDFEKGFKDGKFSYDFMLKDESFVKWAKEQGLDRTQWLKRHIRISMFLMREQGLKHIEMASKQLPEQRKQIEAMKSQVDEKTYAQMKSAFDAGAAALDQTKKLYTSIPEPTEPEAKLLKKHAAKLSEIMEDDEGDDEGEFEDEDMDEDEPEDEEEDGM